ncbi:uncharacterized protein LOC107871833 [Capsicum annuum]|uniref:uncharacterized protein LOC107871833 n=1 Tax=Capsicum annuum TaxID=4072 RepID=UPI0007BEB74F|nr:uncharacterized protein LOC107871833 [Capsicum annuum]
MPSGKVANAMITQDRKSLENNVEFDNPGEKEYYDQTKANNCKIVSIPSNTIPPPFPKRLTKNGENAKLNKFFNRFNTLSIYIPLIEALQDMPGHAKFVKDLVSKKRLVKDETIKVTHYFSAIISSPLVKKQKDPDSFTIPCTIGLFKFAKALCDTRASVNLMPYDIFHKFELGKSAPTSMKLIMADSTIKKPMGVLHDVLVKVDCFIFPTNFVILDCVMDVEVPFILGRPFLTIEKDLMDVGSSEIKF